MGVELLVPTEAVPPAVIRDRIYAFERVIQTFPKIHIEPQHLFCDGIYLRQIIIPKGVCVTGSIYKAPHIHIVSKGDMLVATENGLMRVKGPYTFVSQPGLKRAGYAYEDTVWSAVFRTDKTDPEEIMADVTIEDFYEGNLHDIEEMGSGT
jgi:hypothetical protein